MEMTPMIDVTFLLLVFFMCTLRFKPLEGKLSAYLPKDVGQTHAQPEVVPDLQVRVAVVDPGRRMWAGDPSGSTPFDPGDPRHRRFAPGPDRQLAWSVGARTSSSFDEFAEHLTEQARIDADRPVVLDARDGILTAEAVRVLDALQRAGFVQVRFAPSEQR